MSQWNPDPGGETGEYVTNDPSRLSQPHDNRFTYHSTQSTIYPDQSASQRYNYNSTQSTIYPDQSASQRYNHHSTQSTIYPDDSFSQQITPNNVNTLPSRFDLPSDSSGNSSVSRAAQGVSMMSINTLLTDPDDAPLENEIIPAASTAASSSATYVPPSEQVPVSTEAHSTSTVASGNSTSTVTSQNSTAKGTGEALCNEIEEVPLSAPTPPGFLASSSNAPAPFSMEDLSREQRIALRAQLEDPFSIASKSCFEDDSDEEDDYANQDNDPDSDVDDDLYSDDGEAVSDSGFATSDCSSTPSSPMTSPLTSPISSSFWPSEPAKLTPGHLRHLLSIVPPRDPRRETPLRNSLLRYAFQRRILERLDRPSNYIPTSALENLKLTPSPCTCPTPTPVTSSPTKAVSVSTLRDALQLSC